MVKFSKVARGAANIIDIGPPPVGLEPQGDGWYRTPESVDPRDCNNWASSPFCGGNPINPKLAEIDVEVGISECHIHISANATIFGLTGPTHTIAKVRDECIQDYENRNNPPPPTPPPPAPGVYNFKYPRGLDPEAQVYAFIGVSFTGGWQVLNNTRCIEVGYTASFLETEFGFMNWVSVDCPGLPDSKGRIPPVSGRFNTMSGGSGPMIRSTNVGDCFTHVEGSIGTNGINIYEGYNLGSLFYTWGINGTSGRLGWYYYENNEYDKTIVNASVNVTAEIKVYQISNYVVGYICKGKWKHIKAAFSNGSAAANYSVEYSADFVIGTSCQSAKLDPNFPPPPPPPKKECCPMGQCCPQPKNDDSLIRQLIAEVLKLKKAVGVDDLPAPFPQSLTQGDAVISITSLARLMRHQVIYLDELMGQWKDLEIQIKDADPTVEGDQPKTIKLPNLAEAMAELFALCFDSNINSQVMLQVTTKALIELGVTRKQLHTTQSYVKALMEHQGFKTKEVAEDVPFTFSVPDSAKINEATLEDFLKESQQKVDIAVFDGKDTYAEDSAIMRNMSSIIKAVFWRKCGKDGATVASAIINNIKKQRDAAEKIEEKAEEELEKFIEDVEVGFTNYVGGDQSAQPYGKPYEQRPRIRKLSKPGDTPTT